MLNKLKKWKEWPIISWVILVLKKIVLPGFHGMSLYAVLNFFWIGITKGLLEQRASAIAFKIILGLFPGAIIILSLIPFIPIEGFQDDLLLGLKDWLPGDAYTLISETVNDLLSYKHSTFLSIGFVFGVYYASNSIYAMLDGFSTSYNIARGLSFFKKRIFSVVLMVLLPLFMGSAFLVQTLSKIALDFLKDQDIFFDSIQILLFFGAKWFVIILFFALGISTLYNLGETRRKKWRIFSPGTNFSTLFIILISQGFAWYVNSFGQYSKLYGSLGTIVVLLMWIYLNTLILLLGFELNASISSARKKFSEI
ncbi:MAG: membrane protein [Sphingobacteriales bacterium]|jgi:membrane protein